MPSSLQEIMGFNFSAFPKIEVTKPIRPPFCRYSKVATLKNTFALVTNFIGEAPRFRLAVAHGAAEEEAKAMMERLKAAFPQAEEIYFGTISPALVVHTGPGLLGVGIQLLND